MAVKPPLRKGSPNDFQTPSHALEPLYPYLTKQWRVWECAAGKGNLVRALGGQGYKVVATDILTGEDFLTSTPKKPWDCIVTNPPYSIKNEFIERAYGLGRPFAFLLPYAAFETEFRQSFYKKYGVQVLFLNKRINFETPSGKGSGSWFPVMWLTWQFNFPRDIMFM